MHQHGDRKARKGSQGLCFSQAKPLWALFAEHIGKKKDAYDSGCHNILALRGDPPRGATDWTPIENGFQYAIDLVRFIRKHYGDYFDIAVAGFPQGHEQSTSREDEMKYLREKIDAGASFIITQMFYDIDIFLNWVREVRAVGITVPIVPGIMPIQNWNHFKRVTDWSHTIVPQRFWDSLNPIKDDDDEVRKVGTKLVAEMCQQILDSGLGIYGLHFYTASVPFLWARENVSRRPDTFFHLLSR
jgi:methylenetetrahydrofolate reductase (NADPH)